MATLLLADDSMTTQKVVNLTFSDEGVEVLTAGDGDTALRLFRERRPDIVLADVNMPGMNGYQLCEAIRRSDDASRTPVVLLVGSFEPFNAEEAHRVGANDYLTKPFSSIRRLVATVLAFLDEHPTLEPSGPAEEIQEIAVEPVSEVEASNEVAASAAEEQGVSHEPYVTVDQKLSPAETEQTAPAESGAHSESAVNHTVEAAAAELPEPDFTSTGDIEELYDQSFAETVEMPRALAERAHFSDVSQDDELIETRYTGSETESTQEEPQVVTAEAHTLNGRAEPESFAVPTGAESPEPIEAQPVAGQQFQAEQVDVNHVSSHQAPTEEYNFEYSTEETYFEPTAESSTEPAEQVDVAAAEAREAYQSDGPEQAIEQKAEEAEHLASMQDTDASRPNPWDSVALPSDRAVHFDESNFLELPDDRTTTGQFQSPEARSGQSISEETVERIARTVASQMSEQLIREIAERVVPLVVEQVLARRANEEVEH